MKLSLNEKTIIIFGIFLICLLFLYNLEKDDNNFNNSQNKSEKSNNKLNKNLNNNVNNNVNSNTRDLFANTKSDYSEFAIINLQNAAKVQQIQNESQAYLEEIERIKEISAKNKDIIQTKIKENLITGHRDSKDPSNNYDSFLKYSGNLLKNSLIITAANF